LRAPKLLILDEPAQNIDMTGTVDIYRLIAALPARVGCGVLVVSHHLNIVMAATNRVYCLNGHVCCSGHPEDISRHEEYLRLFGAGAASTLAVYPHSHDHVHGTDGAVVPGHVHEHGHGHHHG
jgi:zinc transport system ATP-binding protein